MKAAIERKKVIELLNPIAKKFNYTIAINKTGFSLVEIEQEPILDDEFKGCPDED